MKLQPAIFNIAMNAGAVVIRRRQMIRLSKFVSEFKWRWVAGEKSCGDVSHMLYYFISVIFESTHSHSISIGAWVFVGEIWRLPEISACWSAAGACKRLSW